MKKKSLFPYMFLLILAWTASCYADNCSVDDWCKEYNPDTSNLNEIWGSSRSDVFAVGTNGTILHYDGMDWSVMMSGGGIYRLYGIWGSSGNDVFAVGNNSNSEWNNYLILHYNGNNWSTMGPSDMCETTCWLYGVWGSSGNDVFAVGYKVGPGPEGMVAALCTIDHYDGNNWSAMGPWIYGTLYGVWGSSRRDVFAVGRYGRILHYDGNSWSPMSSGTTNSLSGVWGSSGNNVFVAGSEGTILHYDGNSWSKMESGTTNSLSGVWGSSVSDVFAVGSAGIILHYDGTSWSAMESGTTNDLRGVWGSSGSDVFAVGDSGTILRRQLGPFKLSVLLSGNGTVTSEPQGIDCPTDCTETYAKNTSVRLTAVPSKGAIFGSWSGGECKVSGTSCTVIMDRDQEVTASFGKKGGIPWSMLLLKNRE